MSPEAIKLVAVFPRNLREGRPRSGEKGELGWKFLEIGTVIARQTHWRY